MKKETAIAAIIVAAVLAFVGGYLASDYGPEITKTSRPGEGGTFDSSILPLGESPTRGPADAAATVVFFTDFSSSPAFAAVEDLLSDEELSDAVRIAVKPIASGGETSHRAAVAAHYAAEHGVFWDGVFSALHQANSNAQIDAALEDAGLSRSDFAQALEAGRYDGLIEADLNLARSLDAADNPRLFVNGQRVGDSSLEMGVRAEIGAGEALAETGIGAGQIYAIRVRANLEPSQLVARPAVDEELAALRRELADQGGRRGEGRGRADRERLDRDDLVAARDRARDRVERRDRDEGARPDRDEGTRPAARAERPAAEPPSDDVERLRVPIGDSYVRGTDDALVTIVAFSDFHCPFCSRVVPTLETLFEEYGSDLRLVFKQNPLPMHPEAPTAAQASLAAGEQGKFWEMHDLLFANQRTSRTREQLEGLASQLGLDVQAFNAFIDGERGNEQIEADQALAGRVGARGTPHFFINGRRLRGAQPIDAFRQIIDEEIALANQMIEDGVARDEIYATLMEDAQERATPQRREEQSTQVEPPPIGDSPSVGPEDAEVTIFVFSEFQCPYCNRARPTIDQIREEYGDQVRLVFKSFPLPFHNNAGLAAQAALAAHEQGKFWEYHDILFDNQRALSRPDLERYAEQIGLDMDQFREALDSGRLQEQIDREMAEGRRAGVSGTPTFIVNGERVVGALPFERFQPVIERALEN